MIKKFEILLRKILVFLLSGRNQNLEKKKIEPERINKVLIIRLNRIGDALVTTPLISLIHGNLNCTIDVLADRKNYFVFENNPSVNRLHIFNKGLQGFRDFIKLDRNQKYDLIIDAHDDVSTTVSFLIELSKARFKLGLEKKNNSIFTTTTPRPDSKTTHVVERISSLASALGITVERSKLEITYNLTDDSNEFVDDFLKKNNIGNNFLVGINISAGSDARFWGIKRYIRLINYFKNFDVEILLLTADKDLVKATEISKAENIPIFMNKDFNKFASIVSKLDFLFTPDTSVVHLASAYKIPMFGIYVKYQTEDIIWSPFNDKYEAIVTKESDLSRVKFSTVIQKLEPFFIHIYKKGKE